MGQRLKEGPLIIVVDDDEAVRDSLELLLRGRGYRVASHADAASLLQALPLPEACCIISDVHMPDMNGLDLIRHLRSLGYSVPVVTITGRNMARMRHEAIAAGALAFLEKPVSPSKVLAAVGDALRQRS